MHECGVSLRKPNKRFQIKLEDRVKRIQEFPLNIWRIRKHYRDTFQTEIPIANNDQVSLHCMKRSAEKTMNITEEETFVKENHALSREQVTVYTQLSTEKGAPFKPEVIFKGTSINI